jgi:hypothetical protein
MRSSKLPTDGSGNGLVLRLGFERRSFWLWRHGVLPTPIDLPPDLIDLLSAFATAGVRYLLVGGHAVAAHGRPRSTKDIDLWLEPRPANVSRACRARPLDESRRPSYSRLPAFPPRQWVERCSTTSRPRSALAEVFRIPDGVPFTGAVTKLSGPMFDVKAESGELP